MTVPVTSMDIHRTQVAADDLALALDEIDQENTMRITESALRRIIRQEARALREASKADKFKAAIASKTTRKRNMTDENQKLATAAMDALTDGADPYDVVKELMNATFASDGRGGGSDSAPYIIKLVNDRDPVAGDQLALAFDEIEMEREDQESIDRRW